jgi:hypothetical protein
LSKYLALMTYRNASKCSLNRNFGFVLKYKGQTNYQAALTHEDLPQYIFVSRVDETQSFYEQRKSIFMRCRNETHFAKFVLMTSIRPTSCHITLLFYSYYYYYSTTTVVVVVVVVVGLQLFCFGPWPLFFSFFIVHTVGRTPSTWDRPGKRALPGRSQMTGAYPASFLIGKGESFPGGRVNRLGSEYEVKKTSSLHAVSH